LAGTCAQAMLAVSRDTGSGERAIAKKEMERVAGALRNGACIEGMVLQQSWLRCALCDEVHGIVSQHCMASSGEAMGAQSTE